MQNKDKGDGIEDSPLDMLLVILLKGASKEVVMPSSLSHLIHLSRPTKWGLETCFNMQLSNAYIHSSVTVNPIH